MMDKRVAVVALLAMCLVLASCVNLPTPVDVPVTAKYITTEVQTVAQDEEIILTGKLCKQSQNMSVKVTVLLNNNPGWDPTFGVVRYFVVDSPDKNISSALCTNTPGSKPVPTCFIKYWPTLNDIYIIGTAGGVTAISFTLDAEFFPHVSAEAADLRGSNPGVVPSKADLIFFNSVFSPKRRLHLAPTTVVLTQIVTVQTEQSLAYHRTALLNFTFCPTTSTGTSYEVSTTVTGTDGESSYAQYLCDKLPCEVDGLNVIAHNGRQLPSNTLSTASGAWGHLYALIVNWGGIYDATTDQYIGQYVFNGIQK